MNLLPYIKTVKSGVKSALTVGKVFRALLVLAVTACSGCVYFEGSVPPIDVPLYGGVPMYAPDNPDIYHHEWDDYGRMGPDGD